ncbi:TIR domain-containing protein [Frankia sp. CNm7]|uniref:TIR domain-containing protein n=1 Tax=Frankia nepalensis TaxID=1836974 RepID=A0A937RJ61_9ACTN|nr:TIR domain-containing protein [Frankia nepalensis]MBL7499894.1 TIR domain-containing protein [Frankia nepalensis]MBL7512288.1 TIR domain-containing protein [Frankia nepalensis]MBL7520951.1 TIR domain-containing protein [Frankia nepalensis]MBL7628314.1 TIR domain-containing protein [Frankia nepalensis]
MTFPGAVGASPGGVRWDLVVSFVEADREWADWLVWQLQDAGRRVTAEPLPAAPPGGAGAALTAAAGRADQVLVVLSDSYLAAAGATDGPPGGALDDVPAARLVAARVEDCRRPGLFGRIVSFDLFGLELPVAREWLRRQLAAPGVAAAAATPAPERAVVEPAPPVEPAERPAPGVGGGVELLAELADARSPVRAVEFPAGGGVLVTGGQDGRVRLFNLANPARPAPLAEIEYGSRFNQEWVRSMATSADGTRLAVVGDARRVGVWDLTDPSSPEEVFAQGGHGHYILAVALSPDATLLASGGQDKVVALWDTRLSGTRSLLVALKEHRKAVRAVAFSPDGRRLASAGDDRSVLLWDVADPASPTRLATLAAHRDAVHAVRFLSPTLLATAGGDQLARLWDVTTPTQPEPVADLTGHRKAVTALAVTADGRWLATGGADGAVRLFDVAAPEAPKPVAALAGRHGAVHGLAFSHDGALLAAACAGKATVLWRTDAAAAAATR